ncbi:MAG: hypothetical protein ACI4WX_01590 [Aristaeellaceae bacterium]
MNAKNKIRILIYGGFADVNHALENMVPANVHVTFMESTRKRIDYSGFDTYDYVYAFWTNISHSAHQAIRGAARRRHIPFRLLASKGAEMAWAEIADSLIARGAAA